MLRGQTYEGALGSKRTYFGTGRWVVVIIDYISKEDGVARRIVSLENISPHRKHFEDFPTRVDGEIRYHNPEKIPVYAKKLVQMVFDQYIK